MTDINLIIQKSRRGRPVKWISEEDKNKQKERNLKYVMNQYNDRKFKLIKDFAEKIKTIDNLDAYREQLLKLPIPKNLQKFIDSV